MADQLSQSRNEALRKLADDLASGKVVLALGNDYPDYPLHEVERELAAFLHATLSEKTAPVPMPVSRYGVRGNGPGFGGYEIFAHDEGPMVHYADYAALEKLYIEQTGCCTRTEREGKA